MYGVAMGKLFIEKEKFKKKKKKIKK